MRRAPLFLIAILGLAGAVRAGPPAICWPIEIGDAKTLPEEDATLAKDPDRVVEATLRLLDGSLPVLARMETLRRASLYLADSRAGRNALSRALANRVLDAEADGRNAALAWFDAGYAAGCFEQLHAEASPRGYRWVRHANELAGGDARMEYALCLLTLMDEPQHFRAHLAKVDTGARGDPLLARNLEELKKLAPAVLRYFEDRK